MVPREEGHPSWILPMKNKRLFEVKQDGCSSGGNECLCNTYIQRATHTHTYIQVLIEAARSGERCFSDLRMTVPSGQIAFARRSVQIAWKRRREGGGSQYIRVFFAP